MTDLSIIIPMAGLSSRFTKAGYDKPKYMLKAHNKSLFNHSVSSFEKYFKTSQFIFVIRNMFDTKQFIRTEITKMGITNYQIVVLDSPTMGQAETVYEGIKIVSHEIKNLEKIIVFNIDTIRHSFVFPDEMLETDGYLEVFKGIGDNWSYIAPGETDNKVIETKEKQRISELCSTGLYYFKNKNLFMDSMENAYLEKKTVKNEYYIAPLYNYLIKNKYIIKYHLINEEAISFSGTPEEYEHFLKINEL